MDAKDQILIRQPQHIRRIVSQLNDKKFSEVFGDLRLVLSDGEFYFYKVILSELSTYWRKMLMGSDVVDVVILENTTAREFFDNFPMEDTSDENIDIVKCETKDNSFDDSYEKENIVLQENSRRFNNISEIQSKKAIAKEDKMTTIYNSKDVKSELSLSGLLITNSEERILSQISPDFRWPSHLEAPTFHSMNWRTADVFEVAGNKSIFSLLSEKYKALDSNSVFSIKNLLGDLEVAGIFNLRDFVNGGAQHNLKVFLVEGSEDAICLRSLLANCGYQNEKDIISNSQNISIFLGQKMAQLRDLTDTWKQDIIADCAGRELLRGGKFSKPVFSWLRSQAVRTADDAPVCMYCGFICYDQSPRGDFTGHMRRHLYRKRKCKKCCTAFLAGDDHPCETGQGKGLVRKSFTCSEPGCSKKYTSKDKLIWHLKIAHRIIERVVTMRECVFCIEMVPNLHSHYVEVHKNDVAGCKFCDKTFANPTKYKQHVDTVHIKKYAGWCDHCQKECASLMKHNIQVHSDKSYSCDHCDKVFKHEKSLEDHMKSVNGTMEKKQCPECNNFYVNVSDHIRRFHRGYKKPSILNRTFCGGCKKHIHNELYEEHKLTCIKEETICHICSKSVKYIENHLARKHQISRIQCGLCEVQFTEMHELNTHLETDHFPDIISQAGFIDIDTEDRVVRENIALKLVELHVSNSVENKYQCKFCNTETTTGTQMLTHIKYHLGYNFKRGKEAKAADTVCPMCGKLIKKYQLTAHLSKNNCMERQKTTSAKKPNDPINEGEFDMNGGANEMDIQEENKKVKKKVKMKQTNSERLPCDLCDRVFQRIANLRKHKVSVHENGSLNTRVSHTCEYCHKQFKSIFNLKKHRQSVHDGVKYPCDQCDHQASDPSNLIKHRKTQHEHARYPCDQCDFISTQSTNLNAHKKAKHSLLKSY